MEYSFDGSKQAPDHLSQDMPPPLFEVLVSVLSDAVVVVDRQQRIRLFNAAAERMFATDAEQVIGQPLLTLIPERFAAHHDALVTRYLDSQSQGRLMSERDSVSARDA